MYQCGGELWQLELNSAARPPRPGRIALALRSPKQQLLPRAVTASEYVEDCSLSPDGCEIALITRGKLFVMPLWHGAVAALALPPVTAADASGKGCVGWPTHVAYLADGRLVVVEAAGGASLETNVLVFARAGNVDDGGAAPPHNHCSVGAAEEAWLRQLAHATAQQHGGGGARAAAALQPLPPSGGWGAQRVRLRREGAVLDSDALLGEVHSLYTAPHNANQLAVTTDRLDVVLIDLTFSAASDGWVLSTTVTYISCDSVSPFDLLPLTSPVAQRGAASSIDRRSSLASWTEPLVRAAAGWRTRTTRRRQFQPSA